MLWVVTHSPTISVWCERKCMVWDTPYSNAYTTRDLQYFTLSVVSADWQALILQHIMRSSVIGLADTGPHAALRLRDTRASVKFCSLITDFDKQQKDISIVSYLFISDSFTRRRHYHWVTSAMLVLAKLISDYYGFTAAFSLLLANYYSKSYIFSERITRRVMWETTEQSQRSWVLICIIPETSRSSDTETLQASSSIVIIIIIIIVAICSALLNIQKFRKTVVRNKSNKSSRKRTWALVGWRHFANEFKMFGERWHFYHRHHQYDLLSREIDDKSC